MDRSSSRCHTCKGITRVPKNTPQGVSCLAGCRRPPRSGGEEPEGRAGSRAGLIFLVHSTVRPRVGWFSNFIIVHTGDTKLGVIENELLGPEIPF